MLASSEHEQGGTESPEAADKQEHDEVDDEDKEEEEDSSILQQPSLPSSVISVKAEVVEKEMLLSLWSSTPTLLFLPLLRRL